MGRDAAAACTSRTLCRDAKIAMPPVEATQLMLQIHKGGKGIAGVYVLEIAETKVATVHRMAEQRGYPLQAGVEPE